MAEWESGRDGVLCTNVAVQAYIMLLGALVKYWGQIRQPMREKWTLRI